jgi:hypothetical protein
MAAVGQGLRERTRRPGAGAGEGRRPIDLVHEDVHGSGIDAAAGAVAVRHLDLGV